MTLYLTVTEAKNFCTNLYKKQANMKPAKSFIDLFWQELLKDWNYNVVIIED